MKSRLLRNLKRSLTRNIGLKLLALFFAAALWFIINNITDPAKRIQFTNMKVEILNAEEITNLGKTYDVINGSDVVPVVWVYGRTSVLKDLTKDDIRVVADMKNLTVLDTLSIQAYSTRNSSDNNELEFTCSTETVQLAIEDVRSVQMVINASAKGSPADGYVVGSVTPSQNIVRISGPESVVDQIAKVSAVAEIDGAYTSDVNTSVELKLFNSEDVEIKSSSIKMNISSINVAVTILATKEVPVSFTPKGTPANGYTQTGDNLCMPETILIAGRKQALDTINEIKLGEDVIDITDAKEDVTKIINVKKYLPNGVSLPDGSKDGNISISVGIEKEIERELEIPKRLWAVGNVPEGFEYEIKEFREQDVTAYPISIRGISKNVNAIDPNGIICVADLSLYANENGITEWVPGEYVCEVVFDLPNTVELSEKYTVTVVLKEKEVKEEGEE